MSNLTTCNKCGSVVRWTESLRGKRYLEDVSHEYDNGVRYGRGPHFQTCERKQGERAALDAASERQAKRNRRMLAGARWNALYRDDMKAWFEADADAAQAHLNTILNRVFA